MKYWFLWLVVGFLSFIGGIVAFANPFAATLTAELLAGYLFTGIGILTVVSSFQDQGWGARIWALLLGVVLTVFGFNLIVHPLEGILHLTVIVASLMLIMGALRIATAFSCVPAGARAFLIIAGLLSIVLSGMIFFNFPWSSAVVLGVFLAVELISNGLSMILVALERREPKKA